MKHAEWIRAHALQALRSDRHAGASSDAKERISSRLAGSIAALGGPPAGVSQTAAADGSASSSLLSQAGQVVAPALARTLVVAATAFAAGGAVGAGVHAQISDPPPKVVYVERAPTPIPAPVTIPPQPSLTPAPPAEPELQATPEAPRAARERPQPTPIRVAAEAPKPASLAEQRALLDDARSALGRGRNENVLETLTEHERRFPQSALDEEREALAIKALVGAGRHAEARQRAAQFKRRFPDSLLWSSVSDAVRDGKMTP